MIEIIKKQEQAYGEFNGGEIIENKPIGFPQEGGKTQPYSNIFYWAHAKAVKESTIGLHPHKGFEIISFVLSGTIKHYDTLLKKWIRLKEGDVQVIKSGSGISHSEALNDNSSIFQIWFDPDLNKSLNKPAQYQDYTKDSFKVINSKKELIGENSIQIDSEGVKVYEIELDNEDIKIEVKEKKTYSLYIMYGEISINKQNLEQDDFAIIKEEKELWFNTNEKAKIFCVETNTKLTYSSYYETYIK
mgnify:CR=1 FL=1